MNENNLTRMLPWLVLAVVFYSLAVLTTNLQLQTAFWKAGHITLGSFLGYWIDRHRFGRITSTSTDGRLIAAAIVLGASIFGMSAGL